MANEIGIPFDDIVKEDAQRDPVYRAMLLPGVIDLLLSGEVQVAKIRLRHTVHATIGYEKMGSLIGKSPDSVKRMLTTDGNPSAAELFEIIGHLQRHEGVRLEVKVCSGEEGCEAVGQDADRESSRNDAYAEAVEVGDVQVAVGVGRAE